MIEWIRREHQVLGIIIPAEYSVEKTTFVSPPTDLQQVGFIVYPEGGEILPHVHLPCERHIQGTSEVLLLREGACWVDFYLEDQSLYCSRQLKAGDVIVLLGGGHGFRMIENTVFLEIKQGPYLGEQDKRKFRPSGSPETSGRDPK